MSACPHHPKATAPCAVGHVPLGKPFPEVCCDCGLAHMTEYAREGKGLRFAATRDEAATAHWRGKMRLDDWLALRDVCNGHIRRLRSKEK